MGHGQRPVARTMIVSTVASGRRLDVVRMLLVFLINLPSRGEAKVSMVGVPLLFYSRYLLPMRLEEREPRST